MRMNQDERRFDFHGLGLALFDISVDQFFYTEGNRGGNSCRKHINVLLDSMNEKEFVVMEATAEGLKKARETEVPE